ncbi:C2H2 type master regulator of conidiophore development brlA [Fusarium oxysporum f. sp. raphani]|uniref:C2H2 type master regulator of conidiophore development brlA n=1 Tax=Fusarium oxysporum f. sp. raphani TaxID=96318 RepID=A0A8J5NRE0_FUSOX|nr:C2H2 type master regulator of conidiophore development brlA [Fusarium oxysporum f. sp. raphani]
MFAEITEKISEEEQRQIRHRATSDASKDIHRCEFPGCSWTFRRNEHLKRHMKTLHREAPESFFCEFCGKNGFSRRDNLKTHRKLHARQPSRKCRVEFVPGAALIVQ